MLFFYISVFKHASGRCAQKPKATKDYDEDDKEFLKKTKVRRWPRACERAGAGVKGSLAAAAPGVSRLNLPLALACRRRRLR